MNIMNVTSKEKNQLLGKFTDLVEEWKLIESEPTTEKLKTLELLKKKPGCWKKWMSVHLSVTSNELDKISGQNKNVYVFRMDTNAPTFSPTRSEVVQESNGLVLQETITGSTSEWEILSLPPKRIFTFLEDKHSKPEEKYVPNIDWREAKIFRLREGFWCSIFRFSGEWRVVSTVGQSMYAKQFCERHNVTPDTLDDILSPLFWETWRQNKYSLPTAHPTKTFTFVFHPDEAQIELVSVRDIDTLLYEDLEVFTNEYNWNVIADISTELLGESRDENSQAKKKRPSEITLSVVDTDIILSPLRYEGYLVVDKTGARVKVKSLANEYLTKLQPDDESRETNAYRKISLTQVRENCLIFEN
eukprot:TRINITY_DN4245_c0_g1_i1.p1 TRINITY_DN4245_c0_g1~~TRINITY_DN4245_c0_g1_i1.p1  ORF type:complete len:359 (+),score=55.61 TRINITY_DN4245_c0_g1_i1:634-1710(+)